METWYYEVVSIDGDYAIIILAVLRNTSLGEQA